MLPWSMPFSPSCHILPDQIPPLPSAAYFHLPMKHYPNQSTNSYASGSGTQPARAVIHPTSQNNTPSQETLNNQVCSKLYFYIMVWVEGSCYDWGVGVNNNAIGQHIFIMLTVTGKCIEKSKCYFEYWEK